MVSLTIKRTNGNVETVDVTSRFGSLSQDLFNKIKKATKDGGKGDVLRATITHKLSNIQNLIKKYNDIHNEGGEGYLPPSEYFEKMPEFKTWNDVKVIK